MLKQVFIIVIMAVVFGQTIAQEEEKDTRPVLDPWGSTMLIDNHTSVIPYEKHFQFVLHHRFGTFKNGLTDLYGIYAPSNIRMGFNYGVTNKLMVGFGTEKDSKAQELLWKYNILEQTRSNSMPVTLTYFGNMALNASAEENFGAEYKFVHRFSYFSQLIVSRKFSDRVSVLAAPGFVHFNSADSLYQSQRLTYSFGGKVNVYNNINLLVEYDNSFSINELTKSQEDNDPTGNLGFAAEIGTGTHTFQITLAQFRKIIGQYNHSYNQNEMGDWCLGFNLIVRFY